MANPPDGRYRLQSINLLPSPIPLYATANGEGKAVTANPPGGENQIWELSTNEDGTRSIKFAGDSNIHIEFGFSFSGQNVGPDTEVIVAQAKEFVLERVDNAYVVQLVGTPYIVGTNAERVLVYRPYLTGPEERPAWGFERILE